MANKVIGVNNNTQPVEEQILYIFYKNEKRTLAQRARKADPSGLKPTHYVVKQDNNRIIIEQDEITANGEVVKYQKGKFVQQTKKDGTIVLVPMKEAVGFVIKKNDKGIRVGNMVTTIRKFLNENAEQGIYGLFATGERLTVEKMH